MAVLALPLSLISMDASAASAAFAPPKTNQMAVPAEKAARSQQFGASENDLADMASVKTQQSGVPSPEEPTAEDQPGELTVPEEATTGRESPEAHTPQQEDAPEPAPMSVPAPAAEQPAGTPGMNCFTADPDSGPYSETLCWLDFAGYTPRYTRTGGWPNYTFTSDLGSQYGQGSSDLIGRPPNTIFSSGGVFYGPVTNYLLQLRFQTDLSSQQN